MERLHEECEVEGPPPMTTSPGWWPGRTDGGIYHRRMGPLGEEVASMLQIFFNELGEDTTMPQGTWGTNVPGDPSTGLPSNEISTRED